MKIAIISDSHDNITNLKSAIAKLKTLAPDALIHCGDLSAPFMIPVLADLKVPTYYTFGNNEAEIHYTIKKAAEHGINIMRMKTGEWIGELELGGKKIAFTHYGTIATALAFTKKYDIVCHGHTHKQREERIENTLVVNPGEIHNCKSEGSFAIYDTDTDSVQFHDLK
jgi:putative phosphoesterase